MLLVQPSLDATELIAIFTTNNFLIMTIHKMMRQVLCIAASFALSLHSLPAQEVVMRIDDMGAFHSVNKACVEGYRNGIATSVEVLVVGPWFPEAVKMLKENPGLDAGVHLAITSEWENIKWRPLTDCPTLVDANGFFFPMLGPNEAYPGQSVFENMEHFDIAEIEKEFRAQIELALKTIPQLSHISGHMFSTCFNAQVAELTRRLAEEYGLALIDSLDAGERYDYQSLSYAGPKQTSSQKIESMAAAFKATEPGKRYLFIDHPAYNDCEMESVMHVGYEDVAVDRQGVLNMLTSDTIKQIIAEKGIRLISIKQLAESKSPKK